MPPGHETPRAGRGGAPRAGGAVRALLATCARSPCASKVRGKSEAFPRWGLRPPRTERVRGMASVGRSGPGEVLYIVLGSGGPESFYCNANKSARHGVVYIYSLGNELQQQIVPAVVSCILRVNTVIAQFALCFTLAY